MGGLYFVIPTLVIIGISFLIVKIATIALMMTGLEENKARFQALSAFTGTGFTTKEAEFIVNNLQRRRIVMWLMILGNAGFIAVIATIIGSFIKARAYQLPIHLVALGVGIYLIYRLATHKGLIRRWDRWIEDRLAKSKVFEEKTVEELLNLGEGYGIAEIRVREDLPCVGKPLSELSLSEKDILILSIERKGKAIPIPKAKELIQKDDSLILYGKLKNIKECFPSS